ncbi:MAG: TonB-dependent receptor [Alphaproteobacteria bacterium]|nr:TonB-dependent receptor [Alphaproteobacteria bacterium]
MGLISKHVAARIGVVVALSSVVAVAAIAQVVGANLSGRIVDEGGGALPGVTVTITNTANGATQTVVTNDSGAYRVVSLQPAPYQVKAELPGFGTNTREIVLTIGANATLDFRLNVSGLQESITVSASTPLVEVARAAPSSTIVESQIRALPVLERNFLALAQLMPGAAPNYISKFSRVKFGGPADQRNGYTTIVDGGDLDDAIWGDPTVNISQDAVQEFKVFRNQFDAQYGAALAAVVTVATKSGTNELHGSGYFFGRDDALNARNAFARTKPVYGQQRFGGSVGGPLVRNRSHFFGAYEYTNVEKENIIALPASNPFAARENGAFPATTREHLLVAKWDQRWSDRSSVFVRYAFDDQYATRTGTVSSDSANVNDTSKMHSVIGEQTWVLSNATVNALRVHYMWNEVATVPVTLGVPQEVRPSVTTGQNWTSPQFFPRMRLQVFETLYRTAGRHDLKFGADYTYAKHTYDAHFYESGYWQFVTDAPFDRNNQATWPIAFIQQTNGLYDFNSHILAAYAQDDWRVADRLRLNLGVRYDLDTNLRMNGVYRQVLADPAYAGLDRFVSNNRGTDADNIQPRLGMTYDVLGTGRLVARAGWGLYITRNRHYFGLTAQDRLLGTAVRIENPNQLRLYPDISAVLGGRSLSDYVRAGAARSVYLIPDDYELPESRNTTAGVGWQISASTGIEVDYVHAYGYKQLGALDLNLPASGRVSGTNPRPVPRFTEVKSLENFTKSWYNALETQFRTRMRGLENLSVSYTLSSTIRDGVNHYQTYPGTMRTPRERGYSEQDTRHNLSVAAASTLPYGIEFSGILRALSGTPFAVAAGFDLDGDGQTQNDRPEGLPITVGREKVAGSLQIINALRATRNLAPITEAHLRLNPFISLDLRATKQIGLGPGQRLELFLEGYNVLNRVNYAGGGNGSIISPALLIRNAARDPRQVQLGARFTF